MMRFLSSCFLVATAQFLLLVPNLGAAADGVPRFRVSTFSVDVTVPLGHPLLASINAPPAREIGDPLFAKGFVLQGGEKPMVLVAIDWLEIRNDAYQRWQEVIAEAAGTSPQCVMVHSVHQHDAPIADLEAQRILDAKGVAEGIIDLKFHDDCVQRVAAAVKESLKKAQPVTHYGTGQAKVERIAANRRYLDAKGNPKHNRRSSMQPGFAKDQPEGLIDPWLKTLSFWNGEKPVVALSSYAVHPQSIYRIGRVSADFPGLARAKRQAEMPEVLQVYVSGASGNLIAGKYNDESAEDRQGLVDRLHQAMVKAWDATERHPLEQVEFRRAPIEMTLREDPEFTAEGLRSQLTEGTTSAERSLAAMGLSCRKWFESGNTVDIACIDLGHAQFVSLPAESYVEFQLMAQQMRPDSFVVVAGYGQCSPGYIFPERAFREGDSNLDLWRWISPGVEAAMEKSLRKVLLPDAATGKPQAD